MSYHCICCEKEIGSCYKSKGIDDWEKVFTPNGTYFESTGNYGSSVFDPAEASFSLDIPHLVIYVCDECLKQKAHLGKLVNVYKRTEIGKTTSFKDYVDNE